jgi:hypothetical protein
MPEDFRCREICLLFAKPSKYFPVGWNNGNKAGFFGGIIEDYTIISVHIPWDAESDAEWAYYFPEEIRSAILQE